MLDGDGLTLTALSIDGVPLPDDAYMATPDSSSSTGHPRKHALRCASRR